MTQQIPDFPENAVSFVDLDANFEVFHFGQQANNFLMVESGEVKVYCRSPGGRDVVLYRVGPGELCVLTTISLLGDYPYRADAITTRKTSATVLPADRFHQMLNESEPFRTFVFNQLSARLADILARMESLMLDRVSVRLGHCLLRKADASGVVNATHEALAEEIGTAREVVSRHLSDMESSGLVKTRRGRIEILDRGQLDYQINQPA